MGYFAARSFILCQYYQLYHSLQTNKIVQICLLAMNQKLKCHLFLSKQRESTDFFIDLRTIIVYEEIFQFLPCDLKDQNCSFLNYRSL